MATVPDPGDGIGVGVPDTSDFNAKFIDTLRFLLNKPIAKLTASAAQNHTSSGNWQALQWGAEIVDKDVDNIGGHDNTTNNSRFTARYAGWYWPAASSVFAGSATGRRGIKYVVNGTPVLSASIFIAASSASTVVIPGKSDAIYLNVGDYLEAFAFQDSGGALSMNGTASETNGGLALFWVCN